MRVGAHAQQQHIEERATTGAEGFVTTGEVEQLVDWVGIVEAGRLTLSEPIESLLARFRRIEITLPDPDSNLFGAPETWLEVKRENNLVQAIETRYDAGKFEHYRQQRLQGATVVVQPLTLRQIFIATAREGRAQSRGAAAA